MGDLVFQIFLVDDNVVVVDVVVYTFTLRVGRGVSESLGAFHGERAYGIRTCTRNSHAHTGFARAHGIRTLHTEYARANGIRTHARDFSFQFNNFPFYEVSP